MVVMHGENIGHAKCILRQALYIIMFQASNPWAPMPESVGELLNMITYYKQHRQCWNQVLHLRSGIAFFMKFVIAQNKWWFLWTARPHQKTACGLMWQYQLVLVCSPTSQLSANPRVCFSPYANWVSWFLWPEYRQLQETNVNNSRPKI